MPQQLERRRPARHCPPRYRPWRASPLLLRRRLDVGPEAQRRLLVRGQGRGPRAGGGDGRGLGRHRERAQVDGGGQPALAARAPRGGEARAQLRNGVLVLVGLVGPQLLARLPLCSEGEVVPGARLVRGLLDEVLLQPRQPPGAPLPLLPGQQRGLTLLGTQQLEAFGETCDDRRVPAAAPDHAPVEVRGVELRLCVERRQDDDGGRVPAEEGPKARPLRLPEDDVAPCAALQSVAELLGGKAVSPSAQSGSSLLAHAPGSRSAA